MCGYIKRVGTLNVWIH